MPGRTDNDIKNYWNTRLKKKLLGRRKQSNGAARLSSVNPDGLKDYSAGLEDMESLSSSALERLQLHMQLQSRQNPLSFYSNPALWPKLHPFQQKMIQSFQSLNAMNPNPPTQHNLTSPQEDLDHHQPEVQAKTADFYNEAQNANVIGNEGEGYAKIGGNPKMDGLANSANNFMNMSNPMDSSTIAVPNGDHSAAFQTELEKILNGEAVNFNIPQGDQDHDDQNMAYQLDCFKEMNNVSRDSLLWWSNEFEAKSASSNSWDSTSAALDQSNGIFHDYGQLGNYGL